MFPFPKKEFCIFPSVLMLKVYLTLRFVEKCSLFQLVYSKVHNSSLLPNHLVGNTFGKTFFPVFPKSRSRTFYQLNNIAVKNYYELLSIPTERANISLQNVVSNKLSALELMERCRTLSSGMETFFVPVQDSS